MGVVVLGQIFFTWNSGFDFSTLVDSEQEKFEKKGWGVDEFGFCQVEHLGEDIQ